MRNSSVLHIYSAVSSNLRFGTFTNSDRSDQYKQLNVKVAYQQQQFSQLHNVENCIVGSLAESCYVQTLLFFFVEF